MNRLLDRARDWRRRAEELRSTADGMSTRAAKSSLLDMAAALEHHAGNLERTMVKFRHIHETATDASPLHNYIRRRPAPQSGD